VSTEAEESPLLEAVARERLVKIAGCKRFSGCCGDLLIVEISDSAVITCSSESCCKVVNKSIHQSKTPSRVTHIRENIIKNMKLRPTNFAQNTFQ
jgi:hypothetical protein